MKQGINKGKQFGNTHSQDKALGQPLTFDGQSLIDLEHLTRGQSSIGWIDQVEGCPIVELIDEGQALTSESITVNDRSFVKENKTIACPPKEYDSYGDCPQSQYANVGDCPQHAEFKRNENQWLEIQGVRVFKPIMEPWYNFVTIASSKIKRTGNNQMTFNVTVDANKMPLVSLRAFDENKQPLFEVHVKQNYKNITMTSSINGAKQKEVISLSHMKAFEQKLNILSDEINQLLDDKLKIKVHSSSRKIEEVSDQKLDAKQYKSASIISDLASHPYAQLACYFGLSCLLFVYGKPIAAVAGRDFVTQGYSMIYGAPTYTWWSPVSLWHYSNYMSAREHVGHWFYNNAEYIMPPVITGTIYAVSKGTIYAMNKAYDGLKGLTKSCWNILTTDEAIKPPKQVEGGLKAVIESLDNLSLEENPPPVQDVSKSKALVVYHAKAQCIEEVKLELITVPCKKVNHIMANL